MHLQDVLNVYKTIKCTENYVYVNKLRYYEIKWIKTHVLISPNKLIYVIS